MIYLPGWPPPKLQDNQKLLGCHCLEHYTRGVVCSERQALLRLLRGPSNAICMTLQNVISYLAAYVIATNQDTSPTTSITETQSLSWITIASLFEGAPRGVTELFPSVPLSPTSAPLHHRYVCLIIPRIVSRITSICISNIVFLPRIRQVTGSKICLESSYPKILLLHFSDTQTNPEIINYLKIDYGRFLPFVFMS